MRTQPGSIRGIFVACVATLGLMSSAWGEDGARHEVNIEAQPIGAALKALADQTGLQVLVFSQDAGNKRSLAVQGRLTNDEALAMILKGSGLTYQRVDERTVAVRAVEPVKSSVRLDSEGRFGRNLQNCAGLSIDELDSSTSINKIGSRSTSNGWTGLDAGNGCNGADTRGNLVLARAEEDKPVQPNDGESSLEKDSTQGRKIEEIVVTAQKREERLIDVPIAITAISGEKLEDAGINNMQDLSFSVPSMAVAEIGPGRQLITIRGLAGTRGQSSLTGLYMDEIPVSGLQDGFIASYSDLRTTDLSRVEVLKGPQGTLFGEGSVGGTVRLVTTDPELDQFGGKISPSVYSTADGGWSGEMAGVLNVPVITDELGLRIAASYENNAGWIDKLQTLNGPVIEEDFNDSELVNVRVKGLWTPTDRLAVRGMVIVHRNDGGGSNVVNLEPRDESNFIIEFEPDAPTEFTDDYELYNLTATYDLGAAQLLSSTSYSDVSSVMSLMQRKPLIPSPNPGFQELLVRDYSQEASSFSQELRFSSQSSGPVDWTAGAYFRDAELARHDFSGFDFVRFGQVLFRGVNSNIKSVFKSESWALFGDVSYALTSRFEIGGGVRYFEDDRETFDGLAANVSATFLSDTFDATTYRTHVTFSVSDDVKVYGSVSTGFRSGGFNGAGTVALGGPASYEPEEVITYELGTKMAPANGRIGMQVALFYSEYTDIQMQSIFTRSDGVPVGFTGNPGEAELKGVEWELNWAATDRLTLQLSGDLIDAEITKVDPRQTAFVVGDPIDLVPEYSVSISGEYGVNWSPSVPGHIRLQYYEQGETTNVLRSLGALEPLTDTPVLNFLNAGVGAVWNGWEFEVFGRNLLDERGALRSGGGIDPQARPRTFGFRFDKSF